MGLENTFKHLTPDDRAILLARAERRLMPAGATVLKQDVQHDALFILADGTVRVVQNVPVVRHRLPRGLTAEQRAAFLKANPDSGERAHLGITLSVLGKGTIFGELSFLDGEPTSAVVVSETPVSVLRLSGPVIRELTAADADFAARFYRSLAVALAERVRQINRQRTSKKRETP